MSKQPKTKPRARKKRAGCRSWLLTVLLVFALLCVLSLNLGEIARRIANARLPRLLRTDARIGRLELSVMRGRVLVEDVAIGQPQGFGNGMLLELPHARVDIDMGSILDGPLVVQEIVVRDAVCRLRRDTNALLNVQALVAPADEEEPGSERDEAGATASGPPAVLVQRISADNLTVNYRDASVGKSPLVLDVLDICCALSNLVVDVSREGEDEMPASAWITARIEQEGPDALMGLGARIGFVGTNIPPVNAMFRLAGFQLDTISVVVPPGAEQSLGGDCLDVRVTAAVAPDLLDVRTEILTSSGKHSLPIRGTPRSPAVNTSSTVFLLASRMGGGVGGITRNLAKGTVEAADTAIDTTVEAAKGVGKTVSSLLGGVLKTAKGVVTLDPATVGKGLEQTTVGTVSRAVGTVTGTAGTLVNGVVDTGRTAIGEKDAAHWRKTCGERWTNTWAAIPALLEAMPFPEAREKRAAPGEAAEPDADAPGRTNATALSAAPTNTPATNAAAVTTAGTPEPASPRAGEELLHD